MPNKKIRIKGIEHGTPDLILSDGGITIVKGWWKHRNVTWDIPKKTVGVKSFRIEGKKGDNPFDTPIPKDFGTALTLHVRPVKTHIIWEYSIIWEKGPDKIVEIFDPKISIFP